MMRGVFAAVVTCVIAASAFGSIADIPPAPNDGSTYELTKLFLGASESGPYVWGWCQKDEATDAWAVWGTGPNSVLDVEAAAGGSFQYVIGGENGGTGGGGPYPATISQNNMTGRAWTTVATLPTNVSNGCAVTLGDTLYVIDGYDYSGSGSAITTMSKMSLTTYIVTSGAGPGSNAYWSATAVVCQNKIYYMGGATTPGTGTSNQCWEYTPGGSPAWVQKANMTNTPSFAQACVYHDTIFVGGGNVGGAGISTVQFYDPDAPGGTWQSNAAICPNISVTLWGGASAASGSGVWFIANGVQNGAISLPVQQMDFAASPRSWTSVAGAGPAKYRTQGSYNLYGEGESWCGSTNMFTGTNAVQFNTYALPNDVGCTAILVPAATADSGTPVFPEVKVRNFGLLSQTNVPVVFTCGSYTATAMVSTLPVGAESTVTAWTPPSFTLTTRGPIAAKCSTQLTTDQIPGNDKTEISVFVRVRDVQTVGIILPTATVDSGDAYVPMVSVRNNGTQAEGFRVRMTIVPDGYVATESIYVQPTQSTLVTFDLWTPVRRGYNIVKCSTRLDGDLLPNNNAVSRTTRVQVRDAGAWAIIAPSGGSVAPGVMFPRSTIHNYGNLSMQLPGQFDIYRINPSDTTLVYTASNSVWVTSGGNGTVTFDQWTAVGGSYIGRLTTILDGDPNPANDTMSNTFFVLEEGHDVGAIAILAPLGVVDTLTKTPQARVKNFGSFSETFQATYEIRDSSTGSVAYTGTAVSTNLTPGDEDDLDFPDWPMPILEGRYYATCYTAMLGDGNALNDTTHNDFRVMASINDVGVIEIYEPEPEVDSGDVITPSVTVHNYGNAAVDFDVQLEIIPGYLALEHVTGLLPDDDVTVDFLAEDWLAAQRGTYTVRCTVMLVGDVYSGNDTMTQSVIVNVHDIGAVAITSPVGGVPEVTITPAARVHNYGTVREPLTATFMIDATPPYEDTKTLTGLPPGVDTVIEFADWLASNGSYTAKCSLYCATDQVTGNEVVTAAFQVGQIDVGVTGIIAPVNSYDTSATITPSATVYNYKTITVSFPVRFTISDASDAIVYTGDTLVTDLAGEASTTVTFPEWAKPHAVYSGYVAKCTTMLTGDADPSNDSRTGSFSITAGGGGGPGGWTRLTDILPGGKNKRVKDGGSLAPVEDFVAQYVYALKGNNTYEFYQYSVGGNTWVSRESIPAFNRNMKKKGVKKGASLAAAGDRKLYATKGNNVLDFWQFDPLKPEGSRWTQMLDVPSGSKNCKEGVGSVAVKDGGVDYVYLLKGSGTFDFYRYDVAANTWDITLPTAPGGTSGKPFKNGSSITYDGGDTIYALKGSYNEFFAYSISGRTWQTRDTLPRIAPPSTKKKKVKDGSGTAYLGRTVYALKGGNTNEFWTYKCDSHRWYVGVAMPTVVKNVKGGGALTMMPVTGPLYAFRGNNQLEFWRYTPGTFGQPMSVKKENTGAMANPAAISAFNLRIAPNPFTSSAAISYSLPRAGNVSLKLYDVAGKLVTTLAQGYTRAGSHTTSVSAAKLASGIYLLKFNLDGQVTTQKLILE